VKKLLIVIDQEEEKTLNDLLGKIRGKISEAARIINTREEHRLAIYTCGRQEGRIQVIVSINGLDEYNFEKHTIEDHLLKAVEIFFLKSNSEETILRNAGRV
jgi:lysyl-tRNA synthetase class II